ncbi:MAG: GNAT family N-acetyltransferase [Anaerolineae bacterium]|nr:GNAT family N-acetyltransferase [Anaerolineae bacterium]
MEFITERLALREFEESDWTAVLAYQSDPLYLRYYEWTDRTPEAVQEFVQMFLDHQQERPRTKFQLAVTRKATGQLIGNCGVRLKYAGAHEGDIGYELAPEQWGHGYATEAARAIVDFGFTQLKLHRISSWCVADNTGSAHVLQKLGMQPEGRLRENEQYKGRYWDTLLFAILDYEWQARQQAMR